MKLEHEFIQLRYLFDAEQLKREVDQIPKSAWKPHHEGFKGNYSVPLVSVGGGENNAFKGAMSETQVLASSPYLRSVISSFDEVIGRSRLMGLAPGAEVPIHSDINYHWYKRVRIHIPIVTHENVIFHCGEKAIHMKPGEAWIFDSWKYHKVVNDSDVFRVHLVIDICGSSKFWDDVNCGFIPGQIDSAASKRLIRKFDVTNQPLKTENFNVPLVMSPGEMDGLAADLIRELKSYVGNNKDEQESFILEVKRFCQDWRVLWSQYGLNESGWSHYHSTRSAAFERVKRFDSTLKLANGTQAPRMFLFCMIDPALNPEVKSQVINSSSLTKKVSSGQERVSSEPEKRHSPVSRNAPCPCGSGEKYKNCHGRLD